MIELNEEKPQKKSKLTAFKSKWKKSKSRDLHVKSRSNDE